MPYISQGRKDQIAVPEPKKGMERPNSKGELNYLFTYIAIEYIKDRGLRYDTIADVTSALDNAKLEFYRRVAGPYEDEKAKQNGDVYHELQEVNTQ